ncbi:MAG TPA: hypothetical protein VHE55_09935 [Fimbriimonadaceae bacterium]|nr:hypothetical protein [Fimbriimonadaceae bacterium]
MRTLALVALGVLVSGCATSTPPRHLALAIDVSDPDEKLLIRYAGLAYRLESKLSPGDKLTVYFFGHDCDLVYEGPKISGRSAFNEKIGRKLLQIRPGLATSGTRTDLALARLAEAATPGQTPTFLVLETDGGIEDVGPAVKAQIASALTQMRAAPGFKGLAVVGVEDRWRLEWKDWLGPLNGRGIVCGTGDGDTALEALR